MKTPLIPAILGLLLSVWLIVGCGGGSSPAGTGTVRLLIADAPLAGVSAVNINIARVDLIYQDTEMLPEDDATEYDEGATGQDSSEEQLQTKDESDHVVTLYEGSTIVNLLDYANQPLSNMLTLAEEVVPYGQYQQLRLYLGDTDNAIVMDDGCTYPLTVPSSMVRIPFDFYVSEYETEVIMLDFDLSRSLLAPTQGHGWKLKPVLHISRPEATGAITGTIALPEGAVLQQELLVEITETTAVGQTVGTALSFEPGEGVTSKTFYLYGLPGGEATVAADATYGEQTAHYEQTATVVVHDLVDVGALTIADITF